MFVEQAACPAAKYAFSARAASRGQDGFLAEAHRGGGRREVARHRVLYRRKREVPALLSLVEVQVGGKPRHWGTARVGICPRGLELPMHLRKEGEGAGGCHGWASVKFPIQQRGLHAGRGRVPSVPPHVAAGPVSWMWPGERLPAA